MLPHAVLQPRCRERAIDRDRALRRVVEHRGARRAAARVDPDVVVEPDLTDDARPPIAPRRRARTIRSSVIERTPSLRRAAPSPPRAAPKVVPPVARRPRSVVAARGSRHERDVTAATRARGRGWTGRGTHVEAAVGRADRRLVHLLVVALEVGDGHPARVVGRALGRPRRRGARAVGRGRRERTRYRRARHESRPLVAEKRLFDRGVQRLRSGDRTRRSGDRTRRRQRRATRERQTVTRPLQLPNRYYLDEVELERLRARREREVAQLDGAAAGRHVVDRVPGAAVRTVRRVRSGREPSPRRRNRSARNVWSIDRVSVGRAFTTTYFDYDLRYEVTGRPARRGRSIAMMHIYIYIYIYINVFIFICTSAARRAAAGRTRRRASRSRSRATPRRG